MSYNQCHIAYRFYNEQWLFQGDDGCSYLCTVVWYVIDLHVVFDGIGRGAMARLFTNTYTHAHTVVKSGRWS